jgi:hypothetical protein
MTDDVDFAKVILNAGVNIVRNKRRELTPSYLAVKCGSLNLVKYFIETKVICNTNICVDFLEKLAVKHNYPEILEILLLPKIEVMLLKIETDEYFRWQLNEYLTRLLVESVSNNSCKTTKILIDIMCRELRSAQDTIMSIFLETAISCVPVVPVTHGKIGIEALTLLMKTDIRYLVTVGCTDLFTRVFRIAFTPDPIDLFLLSAKKVYAELLQYGLYRSGFSNMWNAAFKESFELDRLGAMKILIVLYELVIEAFPTVCFMKVPYSYLYNSEMLGYYDRVNKDGYCNTPISEIFDIIRISRKNCKRMHDITLFRMLEVHIELIEIKESIKKCEL